MTYAAKTSVSVDRTVGEIRKVLTRAGASGFAFAGSGSKVFVAFQVGGMGVKMILRLPCDPGPGATAASIKSYEQVCRSRWRSLLLVIKAKVTSIEHGIETFEQAFLPHLALKDGSTVGEKIIHKIQDLNQVPASLLLGL